MKVLLLMIIMNWIIPIVIFVKYKILDILDISNYRGEYNSPIELSNVGKTIQNNNNNFQSSK